MLSKVNLALWPGEIVALDGARGSGKSTLLRCAAGLLRPDSGSVFWFGGRVMPRGRVAYLGAEHGDCAGALSGECRGMHGSLHGQLERAIAHSCRILLVDDLALVGALERRIVIALLQRRAAAGASIIVTADEALGTASFVSRAVTLENGALAQRRKRSAARIAASSCASRARTSARST